MGTERRRASAQRSPAGLTGTAARTPPRQPPRTAALLNVRDSAVDQHPDAQARNSRVCCAPAGGGEDAPTPAAEDGGAPPRAIPPSIGIDTPARTSRARCGTPASPPADAAPSAAPLPWVDEDGGLLERAGDSAVDQH